MSHVVLALDIAKGTTGWAIGSPEWKRPFWGVFQTIKWEKNQDVELLRFHNFITDLYAKYKFNYVATEKAFVNVFAFDFDATEAQFMLIGVAWKFSAANNLRCSPILIDDWRKRFVGDNRRPRVKRSRATPKTKGRKPKPSAEKDSYWKDLALLNASNRNWFCTFDDEAEALGIMDFALAELDDGYRARTVGATNRAQRDADLRRAAHDI